MKIRNAFLREVMGFGVDEAPDDAPWHEVMAVLVLLGPVVILMYAALALFVVVLYPVLALAVLGRKWYLHWTGRPEPSYEP